MSQSKIVLFKDEARSKLLKGINIVGDAVKVTLGPGGRNVVIARPNRTPLITNDGVSVAKEIILQDPIENLGAEILKEVSQKTDNKAGDGTTTATILTQVIINEGFKRLENSQFLGSSPANVMENYRELNKSKDRVIKLLKERAIPVETIEEMTRVAISSGEDAEMGKIIAEMVHTVGKDGYISVEQGINNTETEHSLVSGMQFYGTYAHPYMCTNNRREAIYESVPILVTNHRIETGLEITKVCQALAKEGTRRLIVIAEKFEKAAIETFVRNALDPDLPVATRFTVLAIKAPSLTTEQFADVATYLGALFIDKEKGMRFDINGLEMQSLGMAEKIVVDQDEVVAIGGRGAEAAKERVNKLKEEMAVEQADMLRQKIERRIGALSGGVGVIRVGASSNFESNYVRLKVQDAINATRAAVEEGVVKGGGLALKEIAEVVGKDDILYNALLAPYNQIQENAGGNLEISDDILDPVKVTRTALENAVSVAGIFLTTEVGIADKPESMVEELRNVMGERE